jgi:hypothetical protein
MAAFPLTIVRFAHGAVGERAKQAVIADTGHASGVIRFRQIARQ